MKTQVRRIFISLLAVCFVFAGLTATARAGGGLTQSPTFSPSQTSVIVIDPFVSHNYTDPFVSH